MILVLNATDRETSTLIDDVVEIIHRRCQNPAISAIATELRGTPEAGGLANSDKAKVFFVETDRDRGETRCIGRIRPNFVTLRL